MYEISVPIMCQSVNEETKEEYLRQLKAAGASRVFLTLNFMEYSPEELQKLMKEVGEKADFFRAGGLAAGVWISHSIGMGLSLALPGIAEDKRYTYRPLVNLNGEMLEGTRCPTDASFRADFSAFVAEIAKVGVKEILLDDDFRFNLRGKEPLCACDEHLRQISELCGERVDRELLRKKVLSGGPNPYRSAWLRALGDSLRLLAKDIRRAVDRVDPTVCVILCASHSIQDADGASPTEITKILAGSNPPQMRIHGAPYWEIHWPKPLPAVFEYVRYFSRMAKADGVERIMAEGDVYPRPRFNTPASHLELFDAFSRADGVGGILKYIMDYNATPTYETGYFRHHVHNLSKMEQFSSLFAGMKDCGVSVPLEEHLLETADLDVSVYCDEYPYPSAASLLAMASIPTAHDGEGICSAVFGENARHIDLKSLGQGAFLDGVAAVILMQKGIDVGLKGDWRFEDGRPSYGVSPDGKERSWMIAHGVRFLDAPIHENAEIMMYAEDGQKLRPLIYRYQNANGQRFMVYMTDSMAKLYNHDICKGYLMQNALHEGLEWIADKKLPVTCKGNPSLYLLAKREGNRMAVGMFNCFADAVLDPVIRLDRPYRSVKFVGCSGRLEGDCVYLDAPIAAFDFVAFEVEE